MPSTRDVILLILNYDDMVADCRIIMEAGVLFGITPQYISEWLSAYLSKNMKLGGSHAIT